MKIKKYTSKSVEDDLKKLLMTIFGQYIKYSENPMASRNGTFDTNSKQLHKP